MADVGPCLLRWAAADTGDDEIRRPRGIHLPRGTAQRPTLWKYGGRRAEQHSRCAIAGAGHNLGSNLHPQQPSHLIDLFLAVRELAGSERHSIGRKMIDGFPIAEGWIDIAVPNPVAAAAIGALVGAQIADGNDQIGFAHLAVEINRLAFGIGRQKGELIFVA